VTVSGLQTDARPGQAVDDAGEDSGERKRAAEGIEIEDATWQKLGALAAEGGVAERLGFA